METKGSLIGKISFGFYLVHGPILWTIGDRLYAAVGRPRPNADETVPGWINILPISGKGPYGLEMNALVPNFMLLPLTLWLAVVVTKLVDVPSIKLSKWLFQQQSQKPRDLGADSELEEMLPQYTEQLLR